MTKYGNHLELIFQRIAIKKVLELPAPFSPTSRKACNDHYTPNFSPEVATKLTRRVRGHFMTIILSAILGQSFVSKSPVVEHWINNREGCRFDYNFGSARIFYELFRSYDGWHRKPHFITELGDRWRVSLWLFRVGHVEQLHKIHRYKHIYHPLIKQLLGSNANSSEQLLEKLAVQDQPFDHDGEWQTCSVECSQFPLQTAELRRC